MSTVFIGIMADQNLPSINKYKSIYDARSDKYRFNRIQQNSS